MSDYGDNIKYKWTPESTTLLVSVWTDKQVQKQLEYAQRPQLIWESVARYMRKKGYSVSAKQCRSRMKQVLVCYREAKRAGTRAGVEQYYESIDKVLKTKRSDINEADGVDTVDSAVPFKSPPKDAKTNKNLKMRLNKYEPIETLMRTEALSPTWHLAHEEEYPDSPESNETVLAQPYRTFSPTRDAATNTLNARSQISTKDTRRSLAIEEQPMREIIPPINSMPNNRFGEMLYQNAVQNVQNQIIQENMQQRNIFQQNHFTRNDGIRTMQPEQLYRRDAIRNNPYFANDDTVPSKLRQGTRTIDVANVPAFNDNTKRTQNQLQQNCPMVNRAMPQEPKRGHFAQNLAMNYKHYKERQATTSTCLFLDPNMMESRQRSSDYSPETADNLNEAFCQIHKDDKSDNLNDSYEQQPIDNEVLRAMNATTITNNATFNDDTLSIEFPDPSPSPSDNGAPGTKSLSGNSDGVPNVPVRKKKVQKLEQLMLSAITSQTDVVNKILAAQDAMVSRFLDLDRDRQNRLENRLDHLMNVVHATVMKKVPEKDDDTEGISGERVITSLAPPPPPGAIPPKLDLVPPKPCRVPCTKPSVNVDLINKNSTETRPGVVSPIKQRPGAIWSKLGPVSQSPFVKAQRQLGYQGISTNSDTRTRSSAERKIAREMESLSMDRRAVIFETEKLLEIEKYTEEQTENARIIAQMGQDVAARRTLFDGRAEPDPGIILSAAFLDAERYFSSVNYVYPKVERSSNNDRIRVDDDEELLLLANQVDNYERLRRLNGQPEMISKPCDTSTPAKPSVGENFPRKNDETEDAPRQTIRQLAQLVAKSARWRDAASKNDKSNNRLAPNYDQRFTNDFNIPSRKNQLNDDATNNPGEKQTTRERDFDDQRKSHAADIADKESRRKTLGWLQDRHSYGCDNRQPVNNDFRDFTKDRANAPYDDQPVESFPIGFSMDALIRDSNQNRRISSFDRRSDMNFDLLAMKNQARRNIGFVDLDIPRAIEDKVPPTTYPRQRRQTPEVIDREMQNYRGSDWGKFSSLPPVHRNMIDRYVQDSHGPVLKKQYDKNEQDSDDDDEFLDTTASMQPQTRKTSIASSSGKAGNCVVS